MMRLGLYLFFMFPLLFHPAEVLGHSQHGIPMTAEYHWLEQQKMPANNLGSRPTSCCRMGEAYPVDAYEEKVPQAECAEHHVDAGCMKAWIADGSYLRYPDGDVRLSWDVNVPVYVDPRKVNPMDDDLTNPGDHGWIWMVPSSTDGVEGHSDAHPAHVVASLYCFIRHPSGN